MKMLLRYIKPYSWKTILSFGVRIIGILAELGLPYVLNHILKNVIEYQSVGLITFWGIIMIACAAVSFGCNLLANRIVAKVTRDVSKTLRHDLFAKTIRLSASQTDRFTIASLESRVTTDTYHIHNFIRLIQIIGIRAPLLLFGGIIITMSMDAFLSSVMLVIMPVMFVVVYLLMRKGIPLYSKVQTAVDNMVRVVREDVLGIRVIKALSKNEYEHKRFDAVNKKLVKQENYANVIMSATNPIMTLSMNLGMAAVVALSATRIANYQSDPETLIVFMQYFTQISMAMMMLTRLFVMSSKCSASAKRIEEVLMCSDELEEKSTNQYPTVQSDAFLEFDNVTFSYNGKKPDVENISFKLCKGQSLGIIGATGSGKSTIVKLLLRFYDAQSGCIRINGRDIRTIDRKELYSIFGTAMQNDFLYADTILENISFGRNIDLETIKKATQIAQAHDFISAFPQGYNHMLSQKGTNVSGGQKQRILITRALAGEPQILILDDSSSALDYKTEAMLRNALNEKLADVTVINVAQRVSAVMSCDLILVIDDGKIIGKGTHEQLLETCVEYKEISDSQTGGAFVE